MTHRMHTQALNIAPASRRPPPVAWLALALSLCCVVTCGYFLIMGLRALDEARAHNASLEKSRTTQANDLRKLKMVQSSPEAREHDKALQQVLRYAQMSWDGILDALEVAADAVHGGVSLVALVPANVTPSSVQLSMTALAANAPVMLAYLEALQQDPRVLQVDITTQQPEPKLSPSAIRFMVTTTLNPQVVVPHTDRPILQASVQSPLPPPLAHMPDSILPPGTIRDIGAKTIQLPK